MDIDGQQPPSARNKPPSKDGRKNRQMYNLHVPRQRLRQRLLESLAPGTGQKTETKRNTTPFLRHFLVQQDHFAMTGSGQAYQFVFAEKTFLCSLSALGHRAHTVRAYSTRCHQRRRGYTSSSNRAGAAAAAGTAAGCAVLVRGR
jgi:hypothetical protein